MILWIALFVLVILISLILALWSMKDVHDIPEDDYSLFLIKKPSQLTAQFLDSLNLNLNGGILSFERLVKGSESVLVIYGPRKLLLQNKDLLDLLELEDYVNIESNQVSSFEVSVKSKEPGDMKIFKNIPQISESEQLWCQTLLSSKGGNYLCQIRIVVVSKSEERRKILTASLQKLMPEKLIKLPKAFSNTQLLNFYGKRAFKKEPGFPLNSSEVIDLLKL